MELVSGCQDIGTGYRTAMMVVAAEELGIEPEAVTMRLGDTQFPEGPGSGGSVTINSRALISTGAGSVAVMSTPRPMEMMRLMGTVAPLAMAGVPQGPYTGVTMTFGASTVTYIDPTTGLPVQRTVPGPMTTTVMFGSPLRRGTRRTDV